MSTKYLLIFLIFLGPFLPAKLAAQPNTLYFLKGVPQTRDLNPARIGMDRGFYISMPGVSKLDFSFNTNNWSFSDLIHQGKGVNKANQVWDFRNFMNGIDKNNYINESASVTLLEGGIRKREHFFSFSWSEKELAEIVVPDKLLELAYYGNASMLGSTWHSGYLAVGAMHYRDFSFTWSRELQKRFSFGITGKLLFGMAGVRSSGLNMVAGMPVNGDQIDLAAAGRIEISAPVNIQIVERNGPKFYAKDYFERNSYLSNFGNPGIAVDLGINSKVNDRFEFSASLIDLGFISWKNNLTTLQENNHYMFRGVNLNTVTSTNNPPEETDIKGLLKALGDTLTAAFFPVRSEGSFKSLLPVKLYVAGEFMLNDQISLGAIDRVRLYNNLLHNSLTLSVNARLSKYFSACISYSSFEKSMENLGAAVAVRIAGVQAYAATDNIFSFSKPAAASLVNLRFGLNIFLKGDDGQAIGNNGLTRRR